MARGQHDFGPRALVERLSSQGSANFNSYIDTADSGIIFVLIVNILSIIKNYVGIDTYRSGVQ
jgi:hypothetical protein